jgi:hypothetical protein
VTSGGGRPPVTHGRRPAFTPEIDALIREIDALGAHQQLWRYLYRNRRDTPLQKIEADLTALRDVLRALR